MMRSATMPHPPKSHRRGPARRFGLVCVLVLLVVLAGVGCSREEEQQKPKADKPAGETTSLAPTDIFSRRAPARTGRKILVVGDSLSISLGEQMERALTGAAGIDFSRDGTRSSGLTRPELVNWPVHLRELVSHDSPDVVVIMIGANDAMPLENPDGGHIYFDNPQWPAAYADRTRELVAICRQANPKVNVYWVGVPAMGDAQLGTEIKQVNAALRTMCAATPGCRFIDTLEAFADSGGRFSRRARDAASGETVLTRTADGVHMTDAGAKLLAGVVVRALADRESLNGIAGVDELRAFARDLHTVADTSPPTQDKPARRIPVSKHRYTVKSGDTLKSIAKRLGVNADDLAGVNPGVDSRHLALGQVLKIPAKH